MNMRNVKDDYKARCDQDEMSEQKKVEIINKIKENGIRKDDRMKREIEHIDPIEDSMEDSHKVVIELQKKRNLKVWLSSAAAILAVFAVPKTPKPQNPCRKIGSIK